MAFKDNKGATGKKNTNKKKAKGTNKLTERLSQSTRKQPNQSCPVSPIKKVKRSTEFTKSKSYYLHKSVSCKIFQSTLKVEFHDRNYFIEFLDHCF